MKRFLSSAPLFGLIALSAITVIIRLITPTHRTQPIEREESLPPNGDFWALRLSYPTGRYEPAWLLDSAQQEATIPSAIPAGVATQTKRFNPTLQLNPTQFTALGPAPLNDAGGWGHISGRVNAIKVDPVQTNVAYLGVDGGGVWKTTTCCSASTSWTVKTDIAQLSGIAIDDITIDPNDHNVVYAATGDLNYGSFSFGAAGVLKSTDQGEHWTLQGASVFTPFYGPSAGGYPQYQAVSKVVVDPNHSQNVIAGTKTGIFFSYDAGANWTGPCLTNGFTSQRQDTTGLLTVQNGSSTLLYAAIGTRGTATPVQPDLGMNGANGVYRTTLPLSGCPLSWTLLADHWPANTGNGTAGATALGRIELAVAPGDSHILYAMVSDTNFSNGVLGLWKTTDGGDHWTETATGANFTGCDTPGTQMWYDAGLSVDPNQPNTVLASTVDLFRSTNGGIGFTNLTCGYVDGAIHVDHHARAFVGGDSNRILIGTDGGVYYSANATAGSPTFTPINDSLNTIEVYSGDISANFATSSNPAATGGFQDNGSGSVQYTGTPATAVWTTTDGGDGMFSRIEPVLGQRWYYSIYYGRISRTTTGPFGALANAYGAWSAGSATSERKNFLMPFEMYKFGDTSVGGSGCDAINGCNHMIAGTYRVWESLTAGSPSGSWVAKTGDLTKNTLFIGSDNRSVINQLHYSFTDPSIAMVGSNDGNVQYVFGLGSTGAATAVNITAANAVLPNRPIQNVMTDPLNPLVGYAALGGFDQNTPSTPGHVYQVTCTTNCASFLWLNKSGNLPNIPLNAVMPNPHLPTQVFAGTDWGLYYTDDISAASPVWFRFEGLPHAMIWDMVVDRGFTTLAVFTRSRGVWVWPLPLAPLSDEIFQNDFE